MAQMDRILNEFGLKLLRQKNRMSSHTMDLVSLLNLLLVLMVYRHRHVTKVE